MSITKKSTLYGLIILLSGELWLPKLVIAMDDALTFGVFPRRNAKVTIKMFTPLSEHLSEKIGREIKLVTAKNFPIFWGNVMNAKYDIVHYNQYHYIDSNIKPGYQVIMQNEEFGKKTIRSIIMVRKDSGINSLNDLKGKTILFGGGKKAFVSYVVNAVLLHRAGVMTTEYVTRFAKNPPNAAIAVSLKQVTASGLGDVILKLPLLKNRGVDVSELKVISRSEPLTHLPWAVKKSMDKDVKVSIQNALLDLNDSAEGKAILKKMNMTGIHKVTDKDYDRSRRILREFKSIK